MHEPWRRALDECTVVRGTLPPGDLGECCWDGVLRVTRKASVPLPLKLRTLLHECLHWVYPDKSETEILRLELQYWTAISPTGLSLLLNALYPSLSR